MGKQVERSIRPVFPNYLSVSSDYGKTYLFIVLVQAVFIVAFDGGVNRVLWFHAVSHI